jgi:hypothetical protein
MTTTVALASNGAGTTTSTQQQRNVVFFSNPTQNPCNGDPGTITAIAKTAKFHSTTQADGNFWITGSAQGTVMFSPTDPSDASASGHFATWFGESSNEKNDVQHDTATFQLWTTDGSHVIVKMKDHLSTNANGVVTVSFSHMTVTCK